MPRYFVVFGTDKPGAAEVRRKWREAHRLYIRTLRNGVVAVIGGPTLGSDEQMNGTMLVLEAPDIEDARDFVQNDPYGLAGLFEHVDVREWRWGLGTPDA